jgi:hypothetical protein
MMVDKDLAVALKGYLKPTDLIKWAGRPAVQVSLALEGRERMFYAAALAAFTALWLALIIMFDGPPLLKVAGFAILLAAVVVGPVYPWLRAWRLERTTYALTDKQVVILENREVTTVPLADLGRIEVREGPDGRGSIVFCDHRMPLSYEEFVFPLLWRRPTLFNIADAAQVRDMILETAKPLIPAFMTPS